MSNFARKCATSGFGCICVPKMFRRELSSRLIKLNIITSLIKTTLKDLSHFGVAGISGGGPYAAACAALLPSRVTAAALINPVGPLCPPEGRRKSEPRGMSCSGFCLARISR